MFYVLLCLITFYESFKILLTFQWNITFPQLEFKALSFTVQALHIHQLRKVVNAAVTSCPPDFTLLEGKIYDLFFYFTASH